MLSRQENELLCHSGPGTPGGEFLRRYWQPVALAEELPFGAPPVPLRILSEELVLFRDDQGRIGLLDLHCSHRGSDLSYGRIEDGGLRCLYHGWLYDIHGNCLEQPNEPPGRGFQDKIHHPAYPCQEKAGVIFAYFGPGEPPLLPAYEGLEAPDEHRWVAKQFHECNYVQGNEGNYDATHVLFLHGFLPTPEGRKASGQRANDMVFRDYRADPDNRLSRVPVEYETEETDYGVRYYSLRNIKGDQRGVSVGNFVLPNLCAVQGGPQPRGDGYLINWHVPIDDEHHWRFSIAFKRSGPLDPEFGKRRTSVLTPDYKFIQNKTNRYMQDREEMKRTTFAGLGTIFVVGDHFTTESAGPIQDRTKEHLGMADRPVTGARRAALKAIRQVQEGKDPPHVIRSPEQNDMSHIQVSEEEIISGSMSLKDYIRQRNLPTKSPGSKRPPLG